MNLKLEGKIALVTGAGGGIGKEIAAALIREGCIVYVADVNGESACAVEKSLGPNAHALSMDVGNADDVEEKIQQIVREHRTLNILVNNAGILKTGSLIDASVADWDQVARVNLSGVFYCSKLALPVMVRERYGKIVNIASVSAVKGGGVFGNVLYGTTKAGVVAFTKGFARELAPFGINVNAISPGVTGTAMTNSMLSPEMREKIAAAVPINRLAEPSDVANLVLFLVSDISSYITGQTIAVDGGYLTR